MSDQQPTTTDQTPDQPATEWGAESWGVHQTHCLYCRKPMAIVALVEHIENRTAEAYQEPEGCGPLCSDCKSPPPRRGRWSGSKR